MWSFFSGQQQQPTSPQTTPTKQNKGWSSFFNSAAPAENSDQQPEKATEVVVTPAPQFTKENFKELAQGMIDEFVRAADAGKDDGWEPLKVQDDVLIDKKPSPTPHGLDTMRGSLAIELSPEEIFKRLVDSTHLRYVDSYYECSTVCEVLDEEHAIVHYVYAFPWPMAKREFVCLEVYIQLDKDTWLAISKSVESDHVPRDPTVVRGNLLVSGYLIRRIPDESVSCCTVTTLTQVDTGGYLPRWVINKDAVDQPLVLARIKNLLEKNFKTYNADK